MGSNMITAIWSELSRILGDGCTLYPVALNGVYGPPKIISLSLVSMGP